MSPYRSTEPQLLLVLFFFFLFLFFSLSLALTFKLRFRVSEVTQVLLFRLCVRFFSSFSFWFVSEKYQRLSSGSTLYNKNSNMEFHCRLNIYQFLLWTETFSAKLKSNKHINQIQMKFSPFSHLRWLAAQKGAEKRQHQHSPSFILFSSVDFETFL